MTRFEGCGTALVTPFTEDGALDLRALRALVEWQIAEGIDFLVPCGSTGEAQTMSDGEREQVVAAVLETAAGRVPIMAGATSNDTARAVDETRRMCDPVDQVIHELFPPGSAAAVRRMLDGYGAASSPQGRAPGRQGAGSILIRDSSPAA